MHFLPNTLDEDAAGERYWPYGFKPVIREEIAKAIRGELNEQNLWQVYTGKFSSIYSKKYPNLKAFIDQIVGLVVIGAENGADYGFETIYKAFLNELPLPEAKPYARFLWPHNFSRELKEKIHRAIVNDYQGDKSFQYAYKVGYAKKFENFPEFIDKIAWLIMAGIENGVDDTLAEIYKSFLANRALPQGRRNPKRLKDW